MIAPATATAPASSTTNNVRRGCSARTSSTPAVIASTLPATSKRVNHMSCDQPRFAGNDRRSRLTLGCSSVATTSSSPQPSKPSRTISTDVPAGQPRPPSPPLQASQPGFRTRSHTYGCLGITWSVFDLRLLIMRVSRPRRNCFGDRHLCLNSKRLCASRQLSTDQDQRTDEMS